MDFNQIKALIISKIPDAEVVVSDMTGTRDHLDLKVTSDIFKGKNLLAQHRLIMDILKESLAENLHAVQIKTYIKTV